MSGWKDGLKIARPDVNGGNVKEIKINNCEATLNWVGLYSDDLFGNIADRVDCSVKDRYVYLLLYDLTIISPCLL